jgi:hypothetical protein
MYDEGSQAGVDELLSIGIGVELPVGMGDWEGSEPNAACNEATQVDVDEGIAVALGVGLGMRRGSRKSKYFLRGRNVL